MSDTIRQTYKPIQHFSPKLRQIITGIGLGFDPCPRRNYQTFIQSDAEALWTDMAAVGHDIMVAITKAQNGQKRSSR